VPVIPSAGPYTVASDVPGVAVVLIRNPNYHGQRPHHFARIDVAMDVPSTRAVAATEAGTVNLADYGEVTSGADLLASRYGRGSPAARHGHQQYYVDAEPELDFFALNTHRGPFRSQRLREAVNYAIDREALARLGDELSPIGSPPFDHYLPPGVPGYRDIHVYPLKPNLAKARQLARGYAGTQIVLWTCDYAPCGQQAEIVKTDLAQIGLRVVIRVLQSGALFNLVGAPRASFDMANVNWAADFLDPADFLSVVLESPVFVPPFEDKSVRREIASASRLTGIDRYLEFEKLDAQIAAKAAPWVPYENEASHVLVSARTGCFVYSTLYGVDLGAMCARRPATHSNGRGHNR
jgi:ABC-type transport system substrate-binding protein